MKTLKLPLIAALLTTGLSAFAAGPSMAQTPSFYLHDGDRVVMYGDSITDQRLYTTFTEAYVTTRFPKLKIDWTDSGWGGDRVGGGGGGPIDVRLQRDVLAYHPTVMTIMLGMNDGSYRPFDQDIYTTYTTGYQHILDTVKKGDPDIRFTVIEPSPYDDITQPPSPKGSYNAVLIKYGEFVATLGQSAGVTVADFNAPVVAVLQKAKSMDPANAGNIIPGRVHPSPAGHMIMAESLEKAWNFPSVVTAVTIDAAAGKAIQSENTTVSHVTGGAAISWDQLDSALPLPINLQDPTVALVLKASDFVQALDQETLVVSGLASGNYDLRIDSTDLGNFTADQLTGGVNLALLNTPMEQQAQNVMALTVQHDNIHYTEWRSVQAPLAKETDSGVQKAAHSLMQALNNEEQSIVDKQRAAAQPVSHHYVLTLVK